MVVVKIWPYCWKATYVAHRSSRFCDAVLRPSHTSTSTVNITHSLLSRVTFHTPSFMACFLALGGPKPADLTIISCVARIGCRLQDVRHGLARCGRFLPRLIRLPVKPPTRSQAEWLHHCWGPLVARHSAKELKLRSSRSSCSSSCIERILLSIALGAPSSDALC